MNHDKTLKLNQTGRSSPALKRDEDQYPDSPNLSTTRIKQSQTPRSSTTSLITAAKNVRDND